MTYFCKQCGEELVDFGPNFLTHKHQGTRCKAYMWLRSVYTDLALVEEEEVVKDDHDVTHLFKEDGDDQC